MPDRPKPNKPGAKGKVLGRTIREYPATDPDASPVEAVRLGALVHELRNLLDGSMRFVLLARKELEHGVGVASTASVDTALRQLDVASHALERMSGLAHAALQSNSMSIGSALLAGAAPITLAQAIDHAALVTSAVASPRTKILTSLDPAIADLPAGPLYTVLLNALRNAAESIGRTDSDAALAQGLIEIRAIAVTRPSGATTRTSTGHVHDTWIEVEVLDDGIGLATPPGVPARLSLQPTPSHRSAGFGLAICYHIVRELGGTLELATRVPSREAPRKGACFRAIVPLRSASDETIGASSEGAA
ncbi:MAG: ATP-binding protein [Phycisphaerales bacterium]